MTNKKKIFVLSLFFLFVILISFVSAETTYCCEKTTYGSYCQDGEPIEKCSTEINPLTGNPYYKSATSCEATSYCKKGTCVDNKEGLCLETAETPCLKDGGNWYDEELDNVPQCQLGCCLLGDEAAFVTQTRCKSLSSLHGLETIFRTDIQNELQCILSSSSDAKGACVEEREYETTCTLTTKKECQTIEASTGDADIKFHEGYLCSADELETNCGPSKQTTCVEDEDAVYFLDTCGNLANVYDSSKIDNTDYWTYIQESDCEDGTGNIGSKECGNCDYYLGSTCQAYRSASAPAPKYGDYICADLNCKDSDFKSMYGRNPKHGEMWCVTTTSNNVVDENRDYLPGTEHYVFKCWEGEVIPEPCDPGRATICKQGNILENISTSKQFLYAYCSANRWQSCVQQETEEECLDEDERDCQWFEGLSVQKTEEGKEKYLENEDEDELKASCVPLYPPAGVENSQCALGSNQWLITYEYSLAQDEDKLIEWPDWAANSACIGGSDDYRYSYHGCMVLPGHDDHKAWKEAAESICASLGDCGVKVNYIGEEGDNEEYIEYGDIK